MARWRRPPRRVATSSATPASRAVTLTVDGHQVRVPEHSTLLEACSRAHVHVPTLCHHPRLPAVGTCRLCLVRVEGDRALRPACSTEARDGQVVVTNDAEVTRHVKDTVRLLLADHPNRCLTCSVSGHCELQDLAARYADDWPAPASPAGEWPKRRAFTHEWDDDASASVVREADKCVKCGRCVRACSELQGANVLGMVGRGASERVDTFGHAPLSATQCLTCGQCAVFCPVGAIVERDELHAVMDRLDGRQEAPGGGRFINVAAIAPSVRVTAGEAFGLAPGALTAGQLVTALRDGCGFDHVFDVNFAADLTIMEEGAELVSRLSGGTAAAAAPPLPMFTSCCPGWVTMVEKSFPELLPHLSTARSPQGMMGSVVKTFYARRLGVEPSRINLVSVMPCTAKKSEAQRPQLAQETDHVLTTREMQRMFVLRGVREVGSLPESDFDSPLGDSTGAAAIFGATGGVMEAALRTAHEVLTGKELPGINFAAVRGLAGVKEAEVPLALLDGTETTLRVAVVHGTARARRLVERVLAGEASYHFVEVMACVGGCIGGGGQPKSLDPDILARRAAAVYGLDERKAVRKSHENEAVKRLYDEFLGEPLGEMSHRLLHTHYAAAPTRCFDRFEEKEVA